jgi:hypothetical protein
MSTKQLNDYAEQYINNELSTEELVKSMIIRNGENQIFLSFHEIAQVIVANQLKATNGSTPKLEYWTSNGEIDIVQGDQMWEVKAKRFTKPWWFKGKFEGDGYYEDAEAQLNKYAEVTDFKRGGSISTIDGIMLIDYDNTPYNPEYPWLHANDMYMRIESLDNGKIAYSFYIINDGEEIAVGTWEARFFAEEYYFVDMDGKSKRKGGSGRGKGSR